MSVSYEPSIQSDAAIMKGVYASLASFLKFGGRSSLSEALQTWLTTATHHQIIVENTTAK